MNLGTIIHHKNWPVTKNAELWCHQPNVLTDLPESCSGVVMASRHLCCNQLFLLFWECLTWFNKLWVMRSLCIPCLWISLLRICRESTYFWVWVPFVLVLLLLLFPPRRRRRRWLGKQRQMMMGRSNRFVLLKRKSDSVRLNPSGINRPGTSTIKLFKPKLCLLSLFCPKLLS